jgi:cytidine deaminase
MAEFGKKDFEILLYDGKTVKSYTIADMLPEAFDKENL